MTTVLAIDQGTSGTKALVVDSGGEVLGLAEIPIRPQYLADGAVEQDPGQLLDSVLCAGRDAVQRAGVEIEVVTLANQGESVLAWDPATGTPLSPIIVWQDRRAESVTRELAAHAEELAARTGLVLDPYFSAPKLAWLRRELTREGVATTTDSWLLHRLTGEFVTDVSTASRSLLTDLDTGGWDDSLLDVFGLGGEALPRIAGSDEIVGVTTAFGSPAEVGGLVVDQQAALLAQGCLTPGEAKCTFGTGAFLLANAGSTPVRSTGGLVTSVAWSVAGERTFCLDGQVYAAASAVRWMQELGLIGSAADLDSVAGDDAGGVLAVPALAGLAAPWWRPDARASFEGMSLATGRSELVTAVVQGLAAQVAELVRRVSVDTGQTFASLRVDGGLTRSTALMQAVADIAQLEVAVSPSPHATPLGAAALARRAADPTLALADAVGPVRTEAAFVPRWTADRAEQFRERWTGAVDRGMRSTSS